MTPSQTVLKLFLDEVAVPLQLDTFEQRLQVQKKTYLAQLTGFDLRYRFAWYVHGPYSRHLTYDVFRLKEAVDEGERVEEGATLNRLAKELLALARRIWADRPARVSESDWLELLASLHYVRHIAYNSSGTPRDFAEAFRTMVACKPRFAERETDAQAAWDQLRRAGLVDHQVLPLRQEAEQGN